LIATLLATTLGLLAGYYRGWADTVISRGLDVIWSFPVTLLAIALGLALATGGLQIGPADQPSTTVGPVMAPPAVPCTIGFWKNRYVEKQGLEKFFPGSDFDAVVAEAVAISSVFATEAELIEALTSKGTRDIETRARQQLAALLLNIAAGNLYSSNMKCRLFIGEHGTQLDTTGDGLPDTNVEAALVLIESNILSGDDSLIHEAHALADDINNGVGVLNQAVFN